MRLKNLVTRWDRYTILKCVFSSTDEPGNLILDQITNVKPTDEIMNSTRVDITQQTTKLRAVRNVVKQTILRSTASTRKGLHVTTADILDIINSGILVNRKTAIMPQDLTH